MAGEVEFTVQVTYADGSVYCGNFPSEIGIRTDDVIMVGWIDPNNVPLPTAGVSPMLLASLPPTGCPGDPFNPLGGCVPFIGLLSQGDVAPFGIRVDAPMYDANRIYILRWMFKFGGNEDPRSITLDFRDATDSFLDESKFASFAQGTTNYKLINRFQVRYRATGDGFTGAPVVLKQDQRIGTTIDPCCSGFVFPGQAGPENGKLQADGLNTSIWHVNEGSPDANAINAMNTLMGSANPMPRYWESIGSRIMFRHDGGTEPNIAVQVYPTYYEYHNGKLVDTHSQAGTPEGNFIGFPYPFGAVSCSFSANPPHLQGRCGDAVSPAETSARLPPFLP